MHKDILNRYRNLILISALIILGFIAYSASFNCQFGWDDDNLVKNNILIRHWSAIPRIFTTEIGYGSGASYRYYRPLQIFSYAIDYSLWRLNPAGYHLINLALHILAAIFLYFLIFKIFKDRALAFLTAAFFVVHPINSEAVIYISNRADLLMLCFMLVAFITYLGSARSFGRMNFVLMAASYVMALLSKENAIMLPALIVLYHAVFKEKIDLKRLTALILITLAYLALRMKVLNYFIPANMMNMNNVIERVPGIFAALFNYLKLLVFPAGLHMEYGERLFSLGDNTVLFGIILSALLLISMVLARRRNKVIVFSLGWFVISFLPVSNIYPLGFYMSEHYMYVPAIGLFLLLSYGIVSAYRSRRFAKVAISFSAALLIISSYLTIRQSSYWKDPLFFYRETLRYEPDSPSVLSNLATIYREKGEHRNAIVLCKYVLRHDPDHRNANNNIAASYVDVGLYEEAIGIYRKILIDSPDYTAYCNLGVLYTRIGKYENAIKMFTRALKLNPHHITSYNNLAAVLLYTGQYEAAIKIYRTAIMIDPDYAATYLNLSMAYYHDKKYADAAKCMNEARVRGCRISPEFAKAMEPYLAGAGK